MELEDFPESHNRSGLNSNSNESVINTSQSSNRTRAAKGLRCVNCTVNLTRMRRHSLKVAEVRDIIEQWVRSQGVEVSRDSVVCHLCWAAAWRRIRNPDSSPHNSSTIVHRHICMNCGKSLLRKRSHTLNSDSSQEDFIKSVIALQIAPRELPSPAYACHRCWHKVHRTDPVKQSLMKSQQTKAEPQNDASVGIVLPNYARAPSSHSRCFLPGCNETNKILVVPLPLRVRLFCDYKYYVPIHCRICSNHLRTNSCDSLIQSIENPIKTFSAAHIEEFTSMLRDESTKSLDFENIDSIPENIVQYFLGHTKEQYKQILSKVPRLSNKRRGDLALAAYLIKIKTREATERISALLQVPRSTLGHLMKMAREIIIQDLGSNYPELNQIDQDDNDD